MDILTCYTSVLYKCFNIHEKCQNDIYNEMEGVYDY